MNPMSLPVRLFLMALSASALASSHASSSPLSLELIQSHPVALSRRDGISGNPYFDPDILLFSLQIQLGTPPQSVAIPINSNKSDIFVLDTSSAVCKYVNCFSGAFNSTNSTTYKTTGTFNTTFDNGRYGSGDIATETLVFGNATFSNATILIETGGNETIPSLGLGPPGAEVDGQNYANLPALPFRQKLANIIGFSIFLPPQSTVTGRLMLGGIDTGKFIGTLQTLRMTTRSSGPIPWTIPVSNISVTANSQTTVLSNSSIDVLPQLESINCYFPLNIVQQIQQQFHAVVSNGAYVYEIDQVSQDTTVEITLGMTTIYIPVSGISADLNSTHRSLQIKNSTAPNAFILGLPFFRYAYTVFDYTNFQFSVASANINPTPDNVTLISATGAGGVQGAPAQGAGSGGASGTGNPSTGLSAGAKAGIAVGVVLGVLVVALAAFFFLRYRKQHKRVTKSPQEMSTEHSRNGPDGSANGRFHKARHLFPNRGPTELATAANTSSGIEQWRRDAEDEKRDQQQAVPRSPVEVEDHNSTSAATTAAHNNKSPSAVERSVAAGRVPETASTTRDGTEENSDVGSRAEEMVAQAVQPYSVRRKPIGPGESPRV